MNKEDVVERFGDEIAKKLPYDATPDDVKDKDKENVKRQAKVCELWDKKRKKAVWLSKSYKEGFLDERDDPLGLRDFFPCPRPLYATMTNESLIPIPDFTLYQDQANELDMLSDRIDGLTKMLQLKGVYDGSADASLGRLFTEGTNGTLLPVKNWGAFAEKGGLKGQVDVFDLTPLVQALKIAYEASGQIKNQVYEIMGISDIVRGSSDPNETLGAQELKGQYNSMRLNSMKEAVAQYATEILQLKAQVICAKFNPQTILAISATDQLNAADQQLIQPAIALLIGQERMMNPEADSPNPLRSFRIEVAADSMVQMNEQEEKVSRMEFLKVQGEFIRQIGEFSQKAGPVAPVMAPLLMEMWKFAVSGFKVGKSIQGAFDETADKLKDMAAQQANQPAPPDPEMVKIQNEQQSEIQRQQQQAQESEATHQREMMEMQSQHALEKERMGNESNLERERLRSELISDSQQVMQDADFELKKTAMQVAGSIEVAIINAGAKAQTEQVKTQQAGEQADKDREAETEQQTVQAASKESEGLETRRIMEQLLKRQGDLLETLSSDREMFVDPKTGNKRVRIVK